MDIFELKGAHPIPAHPKARPDLDSRLFLQEKTVDKLLKAVEEDTYICAVFVV